MSTAFIYAQKEFLRDSSEKSVARNGMWVFTKDMVQ